MNLAQLIDGERVCEGRYSAPRCEPRPGRGVDEAVTDGSGRQFGVQPGILAALHDGPLSVGELHAAMGGKLASLYASLYILKDKGLIVASGGRGKYVYSLVSET